jgi:hypothetical protein
MTGILADYQYTLNDFKRVSLNLDMNHDLSDETIKIVNELASLVGAPTYKRTPVFAKPIMRRERPRRNKVTITASDWEEMRNFKVTELKKNEDGIEKKIDDIRNLLNKITSKNYDKELLVSFPIMKDICTQNFNSFSELFENIRYVSEEDYDEFCLINKENSKRRALSSFFVHLMKEGVIEASNIAEIIIKLTDKFIEYINTDNMKNQVDEICENLFILIKEGIDDIETESTLEESYDKICTFVTDVSNFKPREYKSLTSKTLFKFMDLIEYC